MCTSTAFGESGYGDERALSAHRLLRSSVLGPAGQYLGHVFDIAVRPRSGRYPLMTGLLACIGNYEALVPASGVTAWRRDAVALNAAPDLSRPPHVNPASASYQLDEQEGALLLRAELLGRWLVDTTGNRIRVRDLLLRHDPEGWALTTIDSRGGLARRLGKGHRGELVDWKSIECRSRSAVACEGHTTPDGVDTVRGRCDVGVA